MKWTWACWRLIDAGKISYTEATEKMNIIDVLRLHDVMMVMTAAEAAYRKKHEKKD